jgi:hypothetical protein
LVGAFFILGCSTLGGCFWDDYPWAKKVEI